MGTERRQQEEQLQQELSHMKEVVAELRSELERMKSEDGPDIEYRRQLSRSLTENSKEMIFIVDDEYLLKYINSSALRLAGRKGDDVLEKPAAKVFPGKVYNVLSRGIKDALCTEEPHIQEEPVETKDGQAWLNTLFLPIITPGNPTVHIIVISRDVSDKRDEAQKYQQSCVNLRHLFDEKVLELQKMTGEMQTASAERMRAEEDAHQAKERYKALVDNIPGAVYRCANDKYWTMEFISHWIEEISGYPATDFIRNKIRSFASIILEEDLIPVADAVNRALKKEEPYEIRYRIVDKNGTIHHIYEKGQGIFSRDGALTCLEGVIFDISHWDSHMPQH